MENRSELIIQGNGWAAMKEQAKMLVASGFLPASIKTPEQALAIGIKGHEIGMPMMWSFENIDVIQGKPTTKPQGMLAMIYKNCPGSVINYVETSNQKCVIKAKRPGGDWNTFTFTMENAAAMGLAKKDNWIKQPDVMLQWRCVAKMARAMFPDAIAGISYTPEEMGAAVDRDGNVIRDLHGNIMIDTSEEQISLPEATTLAPVEIPFEPTPRKPGPQEKAAQENAESKGSIYTGSSEQQKKVAEYLKKHGIHEDLWSRVDDELMGKPSTELKNIVAGLKNNGI